MKKGGNIRFLTQLEMIGVERVLGGEEIIDAIYGSVDGSTIGKKKKKERGALVLTPTRVILYNNKMLGHSSLDYPLRSIHSVDLNVSFLYADIKIHSGNDILKMEKIIKIDGEAFAKNVKTMIYKANNQPSNISISQGSQASSIDIADQIKKLADLKTQGILTEEEFAVQKKKLLEL